MRSRKYLNAILSVIAVLLSLNLLVQTGASRGSASVLAAGPDAQTQPGKEPLTTPPFNSGDDRKQLITLLDQVSKRLDKLQAKLDSGINVKVTEMPAVKVESMPKN